MGLYVVTNGGSSGNDPSTRKREDLRRVVNREGNTYIYTRWTGVSEENLGFYHYSV